jgi:hypothetical protein
MIIVTILMTHDWRVPKAKCGFTAMHNRNYSAILATLHSCRVARMAE